MRSHFCLPIAASLLVVLGIVNGANNIGNICYHIDGSVDTDSFRCDNSTTGHTTCCQAGAICYSNGVCQVVNNGIEDFQRVGCTDKSWSDPACLKRCGKYAPGSSAGIRPCDGILKGNHYCCDDGSDGIGSFECCKNASSTFVLGQSLPTVLAQMPLSQLSTTTSTSATSSATSTSTGEITPTSTGGNSDDGGDSNSTAVGLGVGLGVGIPIAAAVAGGIWFMMWRSRKRNSRNTAVEAPTSHYDGNSSYGGPGMSQAYSPGQGSYAQPYGAPVAGSDAGRSGWSTSPSQGMTDPSSGLLHKHGAAGHAPTAQEMNRYQPPSELPTSPDRPTELPS